ncbi:MAG: Gfo/Idh/MocA family protein [Armatimonadota bacterium]
MIKLGLVGCGGIGSYHTKALANLSDRMKITYAVDIDESRAKAAAEQLGAKPAIDFRQVLEDVDAVLLSLPHYLHHPIGMECITAGKHVLMEKPLANTEQECLELIDAAKKAQIVLMVAYPWPYHPLGVAMKQILDEKTYGDVFQVSMWTEQYTHTPPDHWISSAVKLGGGQLFSHGCHYIDLLLRYLGNPVEGTHMGSNFCTPWMEKEGTSNVTIKFENDALGYHFGTWGAKGTRLGYSFHAHCSEGMIEMHMHSGRLILHQGNDEKVLFETIADDKFLMNETSHFIDCIQTGERPLTDGIRSLQSLRVIWRLYEAEQKGIIADLRGLGIDQA